MRTIAAILVAAVAGWVVRDVSFEEAAPVAHVAPSGRAEARPTFSPVARDVARVEVAQHASIGERNLFAYREAPAPPAHYAVGEESAPVIAAAPVPAPVVMEAAEVQPRFGYRFIGTFGTRERRLAAFTRDGEVIAVRAGGKIGSDFVLRSIGVESVEVQALAPASSPAQRVALGE